MVTALRRLNVSIQGEDGLLNSSMALALRAKDDILVTMGSENGRESGPAPDVFVVDASGGASRWLAAIERLQSEHPAARVVVVTGENGGATVLGAMRVGATGFISSETELVGLETAVRAAAGGGIYVSPELCASVLSAAAAGERTEPSFGEQPQPQQSLSRRECEVVELIGLGRSTAEIASGLFISPKTVAQHKSNIAKKLGLRSARELPMFAATWQAAHA